MAWNDAIYIGENNSSNGISTSSVTSNADGSVLERLEYVQTVLGGEAIQLRTENSISGPVEEGALQRFSISIHDVDGGPISTANIDTTSISAEMARSRGGAAFSASGITQPTFSEIAGQVYCNYSFLAAQWQAGDMYRLIVSGISATVGSDTAYVPAAIWSNIILEQQDLHIGAMQIKTTTIDLAQAAASYDLFTGTTQSVLLERLVIRLPNVDVSDDATITSISIQTDDTTAQTLISSSAGAKANLTAEAQLASDIKGVIIKTGTKIQLTIAGGAADATTTCDVVAAYRALATGGYLA